MMYHPTLEKLQQLKLTGMLHALPFEERLGLRNSGSCGA